MNKILRNKIGIVGGGFGLYGYLPASFANELEVHSLKKYETKICSRSDIKQFQNSINFFSNLSDTISAVDIVTLSVNPRQQDEIVRNFCTNFADRTWILEKPISFNNNASQLLVKHLKELNIKCYFGFLVPYTMWFKELTNFLSRQKDHVKVKIKWHFNSTIMRESQFLSWKSSIKDGGGCLSFYACHLLYALTLIDDWSVSKVERKFSNKNQDSKLILHANSDTKEVMLEVDCLSDKDFGFSVYVQGSNERFTYSDKSIFEQPKNHFEPDPRIKVLQSLVYSACFEKYDHNNLSRILNYLLFEEEILICE